ncbi:MAG: hypothetical protein HOQ43_00755, partial [Glycomyces artemisiae]|nr:hypothetical protein [Glycomyces artemisiae]
MTPASEDARYPARLIDDQLRQSRARRRGSLVSTALRTRSPGGRYLLAAAATRSLTLHELLAAAREGRRVDADPEALADLARVVGLQFGTAEDRADALALFDLALELGGPKRIGPRSAAVHAQLAYAAGDAEAVR